MSVRKSHVEVKSLCSAILEKLNVRAEDSNIIVDSLVKADLRGVESHGIARLPVYVERIKRGLVNPQAKFKIKSEHNSVVVIDAENGFGQLAGLKAMNMAIEKAKKYGVGAVSVSNSNHLGMLAYYILRATSQDVIGTMVCNAPPAMAPWGGQKALIGTNPLCIGIPAGKYLPLIVDMATSIVARGKIRLAIEKKEKIPEGWALDDKGHPTTDPQMALSGSVLPLGGVKGYCLSLVVEILSGILSGGSYLDKVKSTTDMSGPMEVGFFIETIDINSFMSADKFKTRVDNLIEIVKHSPKAPGVSEILLPGEIEFAEEKRRLEEGIPIKEKIWHNLTNLLNEI